MFRCLLLSMTLLLPPDLLAADRDVALLKRAQAQGAQFLVVHQSADGSWTAAPAVGITALCTYALLRSGMPATHPAVERGLTRLEAALQADGGIYNPTTYHANYETAIAVLAFHAAQRGERDRALLAHADKQLRAWQWDGSEGIDRDDVKFGGAGYGKTGDRPDLSNTLFFLEALESSGATSSDPAVKNAIVFLSRCQNLTSEQNTTAFPALVNDGGFYYTPAAGGNSQAGNTPNGGLRSYASMTYAGLKTLLFAGVTREDPRVQAALGWIRKFYTLEENPGLGQQGLFYYYHIFAKCLHTLGEDTLIDEQGVKHDWRQELADQLLKMQAPNGSWSNSNPRWLEGDANLSTAYALIALSYCMPPE